MSEKNQNLRWKQRFQNYTKAFEFLKRGLMIAHPNELEKAGIIQAYEFTFELAWKTLKDYLVSKGVEVSFPRDILKKAFEHDLLDEGDGWMDMLEKRNLMAHAYDETRAELAYELIKKDYFKLLDRFYKKFLKIEVHE